MLKIRLTRTGKKHDPHYRIIVMPARSKRDGKVVEYIGYYNPRSKEIKLKVERAKYWLSVGAQPTDTVRSILVKHKLLKQLARPKREPRKPKKEMKKEAKGGEEKPAKKPDSKSKKAEKLEKKEEKKKETKDKKPLPKTDQSTNKKEAKKEEKKK